eukprot:358961-Chlamydomonas_euryale.AAC.14
MLRRAWGAVNHKAQCLPSRRVRTHQEAGRSYLISGGHACVAGGEEGLHTIVHDQATRQSTICSRPMELHSKAIVGEMATKGSCTIFHVLHGQLIHKSYHCKRTCATRA